MNNTRLILSIIGILILTYLRVLSIGKNPDYEDTTYPQSIIANDRIDCDVPAHVRDVIYFLESRGRHNAVNKYTKAYGLFQVMPNIHSVLYNEMLKADAAKQDMLFCEKYIAGLGTARRQVLANHTVNPSMGYYYAMVFYPRLVDTSIRKKKDPQTYNQNVGLDINCDGVISLNDLNYICIAASALIRKKGSFDISDFELDSAKLVVLSKVRYQ